MDPSLAALSAPALAAASEKDRITFAPIDAKTEKPEKTEPPADPWGERVGAAIVGGDRAAQFGRDSTQAEALLLQYLNFHIHLVGYQGCPAKKQPWSQTGVSIFNRCAVSIYMCW